MLDERLKIYPVPITAEYQQERRIVEPRGELAQIGGGQTFQYLVYWDIQPVAGAFRGQHYHLKKEESMYILRGSVQALFEDIDTRERQEHILGEGTKVIILPRLAINSSLESSFRSSSSPLSPLTDRMPILIPCETSGALDLQGVAHIQGTNPGAKCLI